LASISTVKKFGKAGGKGSTPNTDERKVKKKRTKEEIQIKPRN